MLSIFLCIYQIYTLFGQVSFKTVTCFKLGNVFFPCWILKDCYTLWVKILYIYDLQVFSWSPQICKYFLEVHSWFFILLTMPFKEHNLLTDEILFIHFLFYWVMAKKSLHNSRPQRLSSVFSTRNIILSGFTCRSMIHFKFIFMYGGRCRSKWVFLAYSYLIFLALLLRKLILSSVNCICNFVENIFTICVGYFWTVSYICSSIVMEIPHCLDKRSFLINHEIR